MRIIILLTLLIFFITPAKADELFQPVHLMDFEEENFNTGKLNRYDHKLDVYKLHAEKKVHHNNLDLNQKDLYAAQKTSYKKEAAFDDFLVGYKSDDTILPNKYSTVKTFFTKYQKNNLSLQTSYINNPMSMFHNKEKGSVAISPEYRLNKYMAFKTNHLANLVDKSKKNEIQLSVTPLKNNEYLNLNVGAGYIKSINGQKPRTQLNFSTNYKF